ncbi:MAG: cupin domain-containing protein [Brevefilum sp.]
MSIIHRFSGNRAQDNYAWEGVEPLLIHTEEVQGILKHVLIGRDEGAPNFVIRYFHVPVGDNTFYDQHAHEHGIVILHGTARVQIREDFYELGPLDAVFISGNDVHQLTNIGDTPLGFLCVITHQAAYT